MHRKIVPLVLVAVTLALASCAASRTSPNVEARAAAPGADEAIQLAGLLARAETLLKGKQYKEALDALLAAEKIGPNDPRVLFGMGTVYRNAGRYKESMRYLTRLVALAPNDPHQVATYGQIGIIHRSTGNYAAAIDAFTSALKIQSNNWRTLAYLGDLYYKTKQYDLSNQYITLFKQAVDAQNPTLLTDDERRDIRNADDLLNADMQAIKQSRKSGLPDEL